MHDWPEPVLLVYSLRSWSSTTRSEILPSPFRGGLAAGLSDALFGLFSPDAIGIKIGQGREKLPMLYIIDTTWVSIEPARADDHEC